jgi:adenylylsulfate kinase
MTSDVYWHGSSIGREARSRCFGHRPAVVWFTGLSAAGKSTLAHAVDAALYARGAASCVLDGDNVRHGLCSDLGFSAADRHENIRRIGEVARLFADAGLIVFAAFISPYRADRARVRDLVGPDAFVEVYCDCPVRICEARDRKGIYARARAGEISDFTGISAPYEPPDAPDLALDTGTTEVAACVRQVLDLLVQRGVLPAA